MQRVCFLLQVRPERLEEYKDRHRSVWPDMLQALRECGWSNYSLFLKPDGLLVGYFETEDFSRAQAEMSKRDVNTRWQREMSEFFLSPAITRLEEVFHLEAVQTAAAANESLAGSADTLIPPPQKAAHTIPSKNPAKSQ